VSVPDPVPRVRQTRSVAVLMASTFVTAVAVVVAAAALGGVFSTGPVVVAGAAGGDVVARAQDEVVDINTVLESDGLAAGTGMILTPNGEVLTNNHVIQGATSIQARDVATGRNYVARVIGYDEQDDVAVLQLEGARGLRPVALGSANGVAAGSPVVTIGNAGGLGGTPSARRGVVVARDQAIEVQDDLDGTTESLSRLIEIRGDLQPGDSGGPLIDASGQVVGMDTAASKRYEFSSDIGLGFALEIDPVEQIAHEILAGRGSATVHIGPTAFIGVRIRTAPDSGPPGAPIEAAIGQSPAATAGIGPGDVIVELGNRSIDSATALTAALVPYHPGERVTVGWVTPQGVGRSATITLATGPAA
jgi:S1-C subfamily serine protease